VPDPLGVKRCQRLTKVRGWVGVEHPYAFGQHVCGGVDARGAVASPNSIAARISAAMIQQSSFRCHALLGRIVAWVQA
jgi:hypothetical protein